MRVGVSTRRVDIVSVAALAISVTLTSTCSAQGGGANPALPVEPVTAIISAFGSHDVVALGEGTHTNEQSHAFRVALIRDPRFSAVVNDIVVEFGNAKYQDVMDRYVRNQDVSRDELRKVWQNTTQAFTIWDRPIYEELFQVVRALNATLPPARQLRVLLGDPPIDWAAVRSAADSEPWSEQRDSYPAGVISREVLARGRKALLLFGDGHFLRHTPYESIVTLTERSSGRPAFTIATVTEVDLETRQAGANAWPQPSLAFLKGSALGEMGVTNLLPSYNQPWLGPMQSQFDAVLYFGPPSRITFSRVPRSLCEDRTYLAMRFERMALFPPLSGEATRLRRMCETPIP